MRCPLCLCSGVLQDRIVSTDHVLPEGYTPATTVRRRCNCCTFEGAPEEFHENETQPAGGCDHVVGMYTDNDGPTWQPSDRYPIRASAIVKPSEPFNFCPDCGESLQPASGDDALAEGGG